MAYILIAYLSLGRACCGGGPVAIQFASEPACQAAIVELGKQVVGRGRYLDFAICVPEGSR